MVPINLRVVLFESNVIKLEPSKPPSVIVHPKLSIIEARAVSPSKYLELPPLKLILGCKGNAAQLINKAS